MTQTSHRLVHYCEPPWLSVGNHPAGYVKKRPYLIHTQRISKGTSKVQDLDWTKYRPGRAGFIPYTTVDGTTFFCLGVDAGSGELTDLSGGVIRSDSTSLHGGLRELMEESLCVFGPITPEDVQGSIAVHTPDMVTILHRVNVAPAAIDAIFSDRRQSLLRYEVERLVWLPLSEFLRAVRTGSTTHGQRVYDRVCRLLSDGVFIHHLDLPEFRRS